MTQRLLAVRHLLLGPVPASTNGHDGESGSVLEQLVRATQADPAPDRVWLLCAAVFGAYPTSDDVVAAIRFLQLARPADAASWLLERAAATDTALAEARQGAVEEQRRAARAARRAALWRYPRLARRAVAARRAAVQLADRVPDLRRLAYASRGRLIVLRGRLLAARSGVQGRLDQIAGRSSGATAGFGAPLDGREVGGLVVVSDRVVVDVDHSARHDLHTGIQQVVRRTLPLWERDHPVLPVAWTDDWAAWRPLTAQRNATGSSAATHPPAGPAAASPPPPPP